MANVGFHPDRPLRQRLTSTDYASAGAFSSVATRAACQPLDVLKIRLQLQLESGNDAKYKSSIDAVRVIFREEGPKAYWKGHVPAQLLSVAYGTCQFSTFEFLTKLLYQVAPWTTEPVYRPSAHFVVGGVAGVCGTVISYPFDVMRTRLVAQPTLVYSGTVDAARKMLAKEGPRGFYRGVVPTFFTIAPYSGFQFGFYTLFMQILEPLVTRFSQDLGDKKVTMSGSMVCGALAGLCAKTIVFPFDVTKKRLQVLGFEEGRRGMGETGRYEGMVDCMKQTVRREGVRGLFKGLAPGLVKAVATTSINFWFYEYFLLLLALRHRNK